MKKYIAIITAVVLVIVLFVGCNQSANTITPTPPVSSEQVTPAPTPAVPDNAGEQVKPEPTPEVQPSVTPETEKQPEPTPEVSTTPEPEQTVDPTPSVETTPTPEVTPEPTPSVTPEPEVTPTPEPSVQPEPTPTPEPQPEPTPTPEPAPTPSTEPEVAEPTPEPEPTPDATIEYDEGSRSPIDVNAPIVVVPSQTQSTWVEGQKHTLADMKEGAVVVKADGTKVVLKRDPAYRNVLGAGQGVDIFTGLVDKDGHPVKLGGSVWGYDNGIHGKDLTVLKKCSITGEVHTEQEWNLISLATDPNGEYRGDYDGERFNTWWVWHAQGNFWYWSN